MRSWLRLITVTITLGVGRAVAAGPVFSHCQTLGADTRSISNQTDLDVAVYDINHPTSSKSVNLYMATSMTLNLPSTITTNVDVCIEAASGTTVILVASGSNRHAHVLTGKALTLSNVQLLGATASGGLLVEGNLTADSVSFNKCKTLGDGGALLGQPGSSISCSSCAFTGNAAEKSGGAVYLESSSATFDGATSFTSNTAGSKPGLQNFDLARDESSSHGGALCIVHKTTQDRAVTFAGSSPVFSGNQAEGSGGAIYAVQMEEGELLLQFIGRPSFRDNEAGDYGGALYLRACRFVKGSMVSPIQSEFVAGQQVLTVDQTSYTKKVILDLSSSEAGLTIFKGNKVSGGRLGPAIFIANDVFRNIDLKIGSDVNFGGNLIDDGRVRGGALHVQGVPVKVYCTQGHEYFTFGPVGGTGDFCTEGCPTGYGLDPTTVQCTACTPEAPAYDDECVATQPWSHIQHDTTWVPLYCSAGTGLQADSCKPCGMNEGTYGNICTDCTANGLYLRNGFCETVTATRQLGIESFKRSPLRRIRQVFTNSHL